MGREVMEGLRFLTSLPLAGNGQREGGRFGSINKRIISHPVNWVKEARKIIDQLIVKLGMAKEEGRKEILWSATSEILFLIGFGP